MMEAADLRNEAFERMEVARAVWLAAARAWAVGYARDGRIVTINDLRRDGPPIPHDVDPRVAGAVFRCRETWAFLGYTGSRRRISHGRPVAQFRLIGANAPTEQLRPAALPADPPMPSPAGAAVRRAPDPTARGCARTSLVNSPGAAASGAFSEALHASR